jgi:hypothetical protein
MILTSDYQKGIISHIKSVTLIFNDSGVIVLDSITDYDMEFNKTEINIVELAHCCADKDIIAKYTENINIKHLHIEMVIYDIKTNESRISFLDVPCDMEITSLRYKGNRDIVSDCTITLEGYCG